MKLKSFITIVALAVLVSFTSLLAQTTAEITEQEAYIYLHPLLSTKGTGIG